MALDNLDTEFYSPQIKAIKASFKLKTSYSQKEDSSYRKIFKDYLAFVKAGEDKNDIIKKLKKANFHMEEKSIKKYIQTHKYEWQLHQQKTMETLLMNLCVDFGLWEK